jgi:hypothetical protein
VNGISTAGVQTKRGATMPLDLQYLRYCQPGNPFYAPAVVDETGDVFDVSTLAGAGWSSKATYCQVPGFLEAERSFSY